jgi:hypothetical protein
MGFGKNADNVRRFVTVPDFDSSVLSADYQRGLPKPRPDSQDDAMKERASAPVVKG